MLDVSPGRLDFSVGLDLLEEELRFLRSSSVLQPPKPMRGSEWINEYGRISSETSAQPGRVTLWGYQRELADSICSSDFDQITVLKGTRVGYSNLLKQCVAFNLVHEATSVFVALPTDKAARDFWAAELAPLFRDMPELAALRRKPVRGEPADTATDIMLANHAALYLRGAAQEDNLRAKAARRRYADEFDAEGWMPKAKNQGNKLDLLRARGEGFPDGNDTVGSTPLNLENSNVWAEWLRSDQRHFHFTCPCCGHFQKLVWGGRPEGRGIWYDLAKNTGKVERVYYKCENGCEIEEAHKFDMVENGVWVPDRPDVERHAGYHVWQGMSYHPKASWEAIVKRWLAAQGDHLKLKTFFNNTLALPWSPIEGKTVSASALVERCTPYPAELPDDVVLLTAGVDTQKGAEDPSEPGASQARVEISVWGWGRGAEAWLVGHWELGRHEPWSEECVADVDAILDRTFRKRNGTELSVTAAAIDLGGGYGDQVKAYCGLRPKGNRWAVKGANLSKGTRRGFVWPRKASRSTKTALTQWFMLDTQTAKDTLEIYLKRGGRGPKTVHFPSWVAETEYLDGLTAEAKKPVKENGGWHWEPKNKRKNSGEEWDCWVYAYAALEGLRVSDRRYRDLNLAADRLGIPAYVPPHDPETGEILDQEPAMAVHDVGPDRSAQAADHAIPTAMPGPDAAARSAGPAPSPRMRFGEAVVDLRTGTVETPASSAAKPKRVQKVRRMTGASRW